jgi:site-specific recombinase XerD
MPSLERFWTFLEAAGRGTATVREYRWDAGWWERHARRRGRTVYTVSVGDVEAIIRGVHPATARRKIAFLRVLAKWLLREGSPRLHEEVGKVIGPKLPKRLPGDKGAQAFVQLRERAQRWCHEGKREGIWLGLMLMGGLRVSEVASASSIDGTVNVLGKGLKERLIPIPSWLGEAMAIQQREGRGGWAQDRRVIWRAMRRHQVGKPHALRHTYASELLRRGKPIEEVKVLLGHEHISTTILYTNINVPADAAELLDR